MAEKVIAVAARDDSTSHDVFTLSAAMPETLKLNEGIRHTTTGPGTGSCRSSATSPSTPCGRTRSRLVICWPREPVDGRQAE